LRSLAFKELLSLARVRLTGLSHALVKYNSISDRLTLSFLNRFNEQALSYPVCLDTVPNARLSKRGRAQRTWLLHHASPPEVRERMAQVGVGIIDIADYEPCEDNYLVKYLNQEAVKVAMHVDPGIEWKECSSLLNYDLRDFFAPMEPLYKLLLGGKYGLKMLVYSGDDDSVCGTWGTQKWMHGLGQRVLRAWVPWRDDEGQVAGFVTQFGGNLTLATVAGAGHGEWGGGWRG